MSIKCEVFSDLYEELDWFLRWLMDTCPETTRYLYQKWFRSEPINLGIKFRELTRKCKKEQNKMVEVKE